MHIDEAKVNDTCEKIISKGNYLYIEEEYQHAGIKTFTLAYKVCCRNIDYDTMT